MHTCDSYDSKLLANVPNVTLGRNFDSESVSYFVFLKETPNRKRGGNVTLEYANTI